MLRPIVEQGAKYRAARQNVEATEQLISVLPYYSAFRYTVAYDAATAEQQRSLDDATAQLEQLAQALADVSSRIDDLKAAIRNDKVGQQLQQLAAAIQDAHTLLTKQRKAADRYDEVTRVLRLQPYSTLGAFQDNQTHAKTLRAHNAQRAADLQAQRDTLVVQRNRVHERLVELMAEIESLRGRRNNIRRESLDLRTRLTDALDMHPDDLPFVGELLRVRDDETVWEGAVERLLHSYALQVLVSPEHYARFADYVNRNNLRGRLDYIHVRPSTRRADEDRLDAKAAYFKLEVRPDQRFTEWLRADLARMADHVCCDTIAEFRDEHHDRAITAQGQIRRGGAQHQKDDRYHLDDRSRYQLGWENTSKLAALRRQLEQEQDEADSVDAQLTEVEREQAILAQHERSVDDLLRMDDFSVLDWRRTQQQLTALQTEQRALQASNASDQIRLLEAQLSARSSEQDRLRVQHEQWIAARGVAVDKLQTYARERAQHDRLLEEHPVATWQPLGEQIYEEEERTFKDEPFDLQSWPERQQRLQRLFTNRRQTYENQAASASNSIVSGVADVRNQFPEDTHHLDRSVEALSAVEAMTTAIEDDDLPRYRQRFRAMMNERVLEGITVFKAQLDEHADLIHAAVVSLNESLRPIIYDEGKDTYIQLVAARLRDKDLVEFEQAIRQAQARASENTAEGYEGAYLVVRELVGRFDDAKEVAWRLKVTDVRHWFDFTAQERRRSDDVVREVYSDSSGKSGGQKAKLAYTILASAVAYQYGLNRIAEKGARPVPTFRFVVVDEAFSKVDDANAHYAMELFARLGLQLLVVTPMDKIHVVRSFVHAYHYVANNSDGNNSQVFDLTVEQFNARVQGVVHGAALD